MPLFNPGIQSGYTVNGPAAGVMADQQYNDWIESQQRSFRDQDLGYLDKLNQYQQSVADNPVKAAQRDVALSQAQMDKQLMPDKTSTAIEKLTAEKSDAQLKVADNKATFVYTSSQQFDPNTFKDPASTARSAALWDKTKQEAQRMGIKMPDFSPEGVAEYQAKGQQAQIYLKHRQQMQLEKSREEAAQKRTETESASRIEAARLAAEAASSRQYAGLSDPNKIINDISNKIRSGQPLDDGDISKAAEAFKATKTPAEQAQIQQELRDNSALFLFDDKAKERVIKELGLRKDATASEVAGAVYDRKLNEQAKEWVKARFPEAKFSSGEKKPQQQPQSNQLESQVKAAGWPYEPDKYNYGIVQGKFARWPK